ncbi:MAG: sulfatase-like hydrolase/transferase [Verrucomicrobiota bacterium]
MKKLLSLTLFLAASCGAVFAEKSPNILLILTDDHGWSQLSDQMDPRLPESKSNYLETPNINRIMNEGMRFTSGYSPAPLCTPTRRSILCGTSAARSGTEFKSPWIPADHMTIPKTLKKANADYRCGHFGKWGEQMISTPEECGYDASDGMTGNGTGGMPNTLGVKGGHADGPPHFIDNEDPKRTPSMTDSAIAFMRKQAADEKPFYVQASYYAQHLSVVCAEETLVKWEAKGTPDRGYPPAWAAMLEELDNGVGRLLDTLDELEIADNTYVFFTTDNGGRGTVPGGDTNRTAPNHPLTGAKHSLREGGIRVPFMARGPGVEPGSVSHVPVVGYDFLPTFFDLAGGEGKLTDEIDGASFQQLLAKPGFDVIERPNNALIFHRPGKLESAIRDTQHKLFIKWTPKGEIASRELFRVDENPTEEGNDIAAANPELVKTLEKKLQGYLDSVAAEKPKPKQPKAKKQKNKKKTNENGNS